MSRALGDLPTPCAVVELSSTRRNVRAMSERAHRLGVRLRPHVKTHKCVPLARLSTKGHFGGITVSTLAEARHFADHGFEDILYAVPLAPAKAHDALAMSARLRRFGVVVDSTVAVDALEACGGGASSPQRLDVWLKVDCGYHRAGVSPDGEEGLRLAARLAKSPSLHFRGVLTHAGHAYGARNADEVRPIARAERDVLVGFAERLRQAGVEVEEVSVGSTPTLCHVDHLAGVTEVRPGNYVWYDAFQAAIGSCGEEDAAFSVLTTVIGSYPERGQLVVDAGALALSKDPGPTHAVEDAGFGRMVAQDGARALSGLRLASLSQEHGVATGAPDAIAALGVGTRLRVVANHSCLAAALHDRYYVVDGPVVVDEWTPVRGW